MSQFLDEMANVRPNPRLPWVGAAAFSHKGGQHVNAVQKLLRSYEHIDPALVGNSRQVLISELAGRSNIIMKAQELGFDVTKDTPELNEMLTRVKALEHQGYEFEAADGSLALLIRRALKRARRLTSTRITSRCAPDGGELGVRGDRQGRVGGEHAHTVAEGDGPVNALDGALRSALVRSTPTSQPFDSPTTRSASSTRRWGRRRARACSSRASDGTSTWTTIGVNENIIEASLQALVDSLEYGLKRKEFVASV